MPLLLYGFVLLGWLLPAPPLDPHLLEEIRRGPAEIELEETVSIPIVGSRTLPLLEVTINGRGPFRLLLDFGTNVILLRDSIAAQCGARMIVDRERNDIMRVDEMKIGKATLRNIVVGASDNLDVDGVLGFNSFHDLLVTIDYPQMALELGRGRLPAPDAREILSFETEDRMPHLPVLFGDRRILVNFDTGAVDWLVVPASMKNRLRFDPAPVPGPTTWNNQTGRTRIEIARLATDLRFGRYRVVKPRVHIDPAASFAFFGSALLQRFVLTFDMSNRRVLIRGPRGPIDVPGYRTFGIQLSRTEDGWQISDVIPKSRAARLGILPGDVVVAIARTPSGEITPERWKALQESRTQISIELARGSTHRIYDLPIATLG